jgi:Na+/proline symporter
MARLEVVLIGVAYFVVVALIGVWATRRTRTAEDFYVAGHGIGLIALTLAAMSATLSGFAFIGGPGLVFTVGLGAMFIILPASITNALGAWVLAKRLRLLREVREGVITIPDAIGIRFRSSAAQGLAGASILIAVIGYMATNVLALGVVIDALFGIGLGWGVWLGTAVVVGYSVAGGILAGIYADVFQGSLMAVASVLVFLFVLDAGGGLGGISSTILATDPEFLGPWGTMTPLAAISFFFVFGYGSLGQPHVVHKFYMLRDPAKLKWYPLLVTGALILATLLYFGVGVAVKALVTEGSMSPLANPDEATPRFLLEYTPRILAGIVFSSVAAAIMSTVNSFLNIGAAAITHDLPVAFGRRLTDELKAGRIATLVISLAAAITAQFSGQLVAFLGIFGWGLFASTLVPSLALGLNWSGATREGAVASIATGLVVTLGLETLSFFGVWSFPAGVTASAVTLVLSMSVFLVVSVVTRGGPGSIIDEDIRLIMEV